MDLTTAAADGVQAMVDTVEVVSTGEQVIDQQEDATRVNISVVNSHNAASIPSTGVPIEIDPQALSLAISQSQLVTSGLVAASRVTPALIAEVPSSQAGLLTSGSTMVDIGMKRNYDMSHLDGDIADEGSAYQDLPRKKSRNYLDSHKSIEKKRRDRINTSLQQLKQLIPDCRHYGGKKLDKAEILEMTIDYVQQISDQSSRPSTAELLSSQREWVNELMTWIFQNRVLYTGPNSLDQFCSALLLHLQSFSPSTSLLPSVASHVHQAVGGTGGGSSTSGSEDESALRSQPATTNLSLALLQHLTGAQQAPLKEGVSIPTSSSPLQQQQAQLAQLQALLLQQQLLQQQQQGPGSGAASSGNGESVGEGGGGSGPEVSTEQLQQLQQLHQLQTLLIQHLASETSSNPSSIDVKQESASGASNGSSQVQDTGNNASGSVMVGSSDPSILSTVTDTSCISTQTNTTGSGGEISGLSTSAIQASGPTTSIYSSSLSSGLDADNLLRSMGDGGGQAVWSEEQPQGELLMLSSTRDEGTAPTMIQEEVTFLTHQQQQH